MRWLGIVLLILACASAFGAQPRVNGVEVVPSTNGHARDLTVSAVLRAQGVASSNMLIATNFTITTNITTLFVDATHSNIVITLPTNTVLLNGQTWRLQVVKGTNLLDLRPLRPGFDLIGFATNLTLAYGEGATIEKIGTNFFCSTTSSGGPVGTVTSWFRDMAGVPKLSSLWKVCDGTAVNDLGSPLNGVSTPLISDGRFIKNFTTSGQSTDFAGYGAVLADVNLDGLTETFVTGSVSPGLPSEPSNITAIPIMRVK